MSCPQLSDTIQAQFPGSLQCLTRCLPQFQTHILALSIFRGAVRSTPLQRQWVQTSARKLCLNLCLEVNHYLILRSRLPLALTLLSDTSPKLALSALYILLRSLNCSFLLFMWDFLPSFPHRFATVNNSLPARWHWPSAALRRKAGGTEEPWGHRATLWSLFCLLSAMAFSLLRWLHSSHTALACHYNNSIHVLFLF